MRTKQQLGYGLDGDNARVAIGRLLGRHRDVGIKTTSKVATGGSEAHWNDGSEDDAVSLEMKKTMMDRVLCGDSTTATRVCEGNAA